VKIVRDEKFTQALTGILVYIARDSKSGARFFRNALQKTIGTLDTFPYKYRQSYYYNDSQIRDLIFKGYTIPYLIDEKRDVIVILDIFKWIEKKRKE